MIWNNADIVRNLATKIGIKTQSLGAAYFFTGVLVLWSAGETTGHYLDIEYECEYEYKT